MEHCRGRHAAGTRERAAFDAARDETSLLRLLPADSPSVLLQGVDKKIEAHLHPETINAGKGVRA